ncbi:MAG TPA: histidine kinase [Bacteroidia bacterium]|nr:histidine kinase [Bacteroidia bacterium]
MFRNCIPSANRILINNKLNPGETIMGSGGTYATLVDSSYGLFWNNVYIKAPLSLSITPDGNSWIGICNKTGDIAYIPSSKELLVIQKNTLEKKRYFFSNSIVKLFIDSNNDLWLTTYKSGGYLFKNSDLDSKPIRFLNSLTVSSMMEDSEGTIWASTLEKGIFVCRNKGVFRIPNNNSKIALSQIEANKIVFTYYTKNRISFFTNDSIYKDSISFSNREDLLFFFSTQDYNYYALHTGLYGKSRKSNSPASIFKYLGVKDVLMLNDDTIMVASTRDILQIYKNKTLYDLQPPFSINFITKLKDGKILIGSRDNNGIYELKNKQFFHFLPQLHELNIRINSVIEDQKGRLWIASNENGLYCYDEHHQLHAIKKNSELIPNKINSLALDDKNNIWCATTNGLIKIQNTNYLKNITVTNFVKEHGVPDIRIEKVFSFNESIWCLTKDNLFYFKSDVLKKNSKFPTTYIESISVNGKAVFFKDSLTTSYDQNNFQIVTTMSSYRNTEKRNFVYKLNGYDTEWHFSNNSDIQYTNLDYGNYELLVYGLNNDNYKSEKPATITFIIKKPFWYTWWFILIEVSVLFLLFSFFFNLWRRRIEKKEHEKAVINQRIAEFKMTALRSQMNPHFIFNAIGSIQHYILKNDIKNSSTYLAKFAQLIRNILNNSREEYISLSQEIATLRLYIELEQIRFKNPFTFILEIDNELDMETDIPTMLIQPYIENSIWHGLMPKEKDGVLQLSFKKKEDYILVIINDNGVGRKRKDAENKTHTSRGMSITEQRIQVLESTNTKKFKTTIIDLKDENSIPIGTEVNLIIPINL